jgi:hypothetical protein
MIRLGTVKRLGVKISKSSQSVNQADGSSPLKVVGEVRFMLSYDSFDYAFEGLVIEDLDVEILGGTPFMEANDISIRPAKRQVILKGDTVCYYGSQKRTSEYHSVRRVSHIIRAPAQTSTIWPGEYLEVDAPSDFDNTVAIEPTTSIQPLVHETTWPSPGVVTSVARRIRIPNNTDSPVVVKKNAHICNVF